MNGIENLHRKLLLLGIKHKYNGWAVVVLDRKMNVIKDYRLIRGDSIG